jgi:predicted alpha/beta hydrolase
MRAICMTDDPWATRPAVERLCAAYSSITPEILSVSPRELGVSKIGHLGFFRPEHRDTLWRGAAEWLEA